MKKMKTIVILLAACLAVNASSRSSVRIVGGSLATVSQYPYVASLLFSWDLINYNQVCAGTILTTRAILSAAHCVAGDAAVRWRARLGSSFANSGGVVLTVERLTVHPRYNTVTQDNDVAILRTASVIPYQKGIQPASIAGSSYSLLDNQSVWAIGWGMTSYNGPQSEQLRHVQIWSINQATCRQRYAGIGLTVTDNMLCSGWLDVGGRDQCQGDSGGPLIHNGVVVGICSWGYQCALAYYPGVNTRVSRYTSWIQANA